jgi:O-antigen/teichoic acid export membrane protein
VAQILVGRADLEHFEGMLVVTVAHELADEPRLIRDRTTFIATIGQICRIALKTIRMRQATRLSTRKRSTRACINEKISSADPTQPSASNQLMGGTLLCASLRGSRQWRCGAWHRVLRMPHARRILSVASRGLWISVGPGVLAIGGYAYVLLSSMRLDTQGAVTCLSFYFLASLLGPGTFYAVEQAVGRRPPSAGGLLEAVRALGRPAAGLTTLAVATANVAVAVIVGVRPDDQPAIFISATAFPCLSLAVHTQRGLIVSRGQMTRYSESLLWEGVGRLALCTAVAMAGATSADAYILAFVGGTAVSLAAGARWTRFGGKNATRWPQGQLVETVRHPEVWGLALSALAAQSLPNLAPLIVTARLGDESDAALAFSQAVVLARLPLLLIPSVQGFLLLRLSRSARMHRPDSLNSLMRRGHGCVLVAGGLFVILLAAVGPAVLQVAFDTEGVSVAVLVVLGVATVATTSVAVFQTALVALSRPSITGAIWVVGCLVVAVVSLAGGPPVTAGTLGHAAGPLAAVAVARMLFRRAQASWRLLTPTAR